MSFLGCRAPHGEQGRCGFPGALRSQRFLLSGRPRPLSAVHRVLFYGFPLGSSSHWVFLAWTLSLPQPLTTLGANLYLYLALPSTHHGWRFLNPPGARSHVLPRCSPGTLDLPTWPFTLGNKLFTLVPSTSAVTSFGRACTFLVGNQLTRYGSQTHSTNIC